MNKPIVMALGLCLSGAAAAAEVTVKNDSLTDFGAGTIQAGFVAGERAASWLTSPCDGNVVAVQIYWASLTGGTPFSLQEAITIHRAGTYPTPGAVAEEILGPVLNDGFLNEYRYLDENSTIPLLVPVASAETFVVAFTFGETPNPSGPSVVNDNDGAQPNRNAIYADLGDTFMWFPNTTLGVNGDWVIRAVVDCTAGGSQADLGATMSASVSEYVPGGPLGYTITVANTGPSASPTTTIIDTFPVAYTGVTWTCTPTGGATCTANGGGGTLAQIVNLPSGASVTYAVNGTVQAGTTGTLSNSVSVVAGGVTDPDQDNNTASLDLEPAAVVLEADLEVEVTSEAEQYLPGAAVDYVVTVRNHGPDNATANLASALPDGFSASTWTCQPSGGATCAATGNGSIDDTLSLPADASAVYAVTGEVSPDAKGTLMISAAVEADAPALDPQPDNNTSSLSLEAGATEDDTIFENGFDSSAPAGARALVVWPAPLRARR